MEDIPKLLKQVGTLELILFQEGRGLLVRNSDGFSITPDNITSRLMIVVKVYPNLLKRGFCSILGLIPKIKEKAVGDIYLNSDNLEITMKGYSYTASLSRIIKKIHEQMKLTVTINDKEDIRGFRLIDSH